MRILQEGFGSPRPLLLVYHSNASKDAAIVQTASPNALVVNDTRTDHYVTVPPLSTTIADLSAQVNASLSPVVLAGFSEGGLVTKSLLDRGADPDTLIIADGTYGSDFTSWKRYADRAKRGEREMLASYSAGTDRPWRGLVSVTGMPLKFGPDLPQPAKWVDGNLTVFGYGDGDHSKQGAVVLPQMISSAFSNVVVPPTRSSSRIVPIVVVGTLIGAAAAVTYYWK